ncbi:MAG: hypothetical protein ACRCT7_08715, partial [Shewanella sp.]
MYRRTTARPQGSLTVIDYIERHPTEKQRLNVLTSYYDQQQANTVIEFDRMQLGVFSLNELQLLMENV